VVPGDALKRWVVLLSPVLVVGVGFVLARLAAAAWGAWSWIPILIYYWGSLIALTAWGDGRESMGRWLKPSQPARWIWAWRVLAVAVPALALATGFLPGLASMEGWWVVVLWFSLGIINPWIEEPYWRGLVLDTASGWHTWLPVLYSAICFGASRPLLFGWQEGDLLNGFAGLVGNSIAGVIWGFVYRQTRSLRLPLLGHLLQQILAPPYSVFSQLIAMFQ
jgi:membrane protease YdiL (CAAX protease family)